MLKTSMAQLEDLKHERAATYPAVLLVRVSLSARVKFGESLSFLAIRLS